MCYATTCIPWILQPCLGSNLMQHFNYKCRDYFLASQASGHAHASNFTRESLLMNWFYVGLFCFQHLFFLASQILWENHLHANHGKDLQFFTEALILGSVIPYYIPLLITRKTCDAFPQSEGGSSHHEVSTAVWEEGFEQCICWGLFFQSEGPVEASQCVTVLQTVVWRLKPLQQDMNVLVFGLERERVI